MDLNVRKEQFSIAHVRAVAAVAGIKILRAEVDDDNIDIGLERSGGCAPKLDLQLKCTADVHPANGAGGSFALKLKNYDDLRRATVIPRWLVVMYVPTTAADWLSFAALQHGNIGQFFDNAMTSETRCVRGGGLRAVGRVPMEGGRGKRKAGRRKHTPDRQSKYEL